MSGWVVKFELPECIGVREAEVKKPKYTNIEKRMLREIKRKFKKR